MACPYYKSGYCVSPLLEKPDSNITSASRCIYNFKTCRYYVNNNENEGGVLGMNSQDSKKQYKFNFYAAVNKLDEQPKSGCEFFTTFKSNGGYVVKCKILDRLITSTQIQLCVKYWTNCPLRKMVE
ncbi:MAG: hypothetical protein QXV69_02545 [Sulfolobaceae archaeon]